jgi:anti-anti-sigma factor
MPDAPLLPDSIDGLPAAPRFTLEGTPASGDLDLAWLHPADELDLASTPHLELALAELQTQARLVVLDLRDSTFIGCSAVHVIVNSSIRARQSGRRIVLLRAQPNVDRVFTLTGSADNVEAYDIDPVEPPVQVLPKLAAWGIVA